MKALLLILFIFLASCSKPVSKPIYSGEKDELSKIVDDSIKAYNNYDFISYKNSFSEEINFFKEHARGKVQIISGFKDFYKHFFPVFKAKKNNIKVINSFYHSPWVFKHQIITAPPRKLEAVVGYKIKDKKIIDVLIMGEKELSIDPR